MKTLSPYLLLLSFAGFTSNTFANDAVDTSSISLGGVYSNTSSDYDSDTYSVSGTLTMPISGFDHMGVRAAFNRTHDNTTDNSNINYKSDMTRGNLNAFFRDSNIGGILAGYDYAHMETHTKFPTLWNLSPVSNTLNTATKTIKGEYYLDQITLSGRLADSDGSTLDIAQQGVAATWYPKENHALKLIVDHAHINPNFAASFNNTTYSVNSESQPAFLAGKGDVRFAYAWDSQSSNKGVLIGGDYYFSNFEFMKSTPVIGLTATHSTSGTNMVFLDFGLKFDNSISLKVRDRKYLFSPNL